MPDKKNKFEVDQYFVQKEKNKVFKIIHKEWIEGVRNGTKSKVKNNEVVVKDWLYDIEYCGEKIVRRYYESRLEEECEKLNNAEVLKAIYD